MRLFCCAILKEHSFLPPLLIDRSRSNRECRAPSMSKSSAYISRRELIFMDLEPHIEDH
jgi:hypothetical protein